MNIALIILSVFFAAFVQSLAGFGFALIVMPLVTLVLGIQTAAPLVAVVALTVYTVNLARFRQAINASEVLRLGLASLLGVPVGLWILSNVDESVVTMTLGVILIAYGVFTLVQPTALGMPSRRWAYPTGFLAGCLGGAFNAPGPAAVVYGSLRRWPKDEFRAAMQALFFVNAVLVVSAHAVARHLSKEILSMYVYALPPLVLGILLASRVDHKVDRDRFRRLVTVMILVMGLGLFLGVG